MGLKFSPHKGQFRSTILGKTRGFFSHPKHNSNQVRLRAHGIVLPNSQLHFRSFLMVCTASNLSETGGFNNFGLNFPWLKRHRGMTIGQWFNPQVDAVQFDELTGQVCPKSIFSSRFLPNSYAKRVILRPMIS